MPTTTDNEVLNWILEPAARCVSYVAEETKIASVLHRGLSALSNQDVYLLLARQFMLDHDAETKGIDFLIQEQIVLGQWARELLDEDFHSVNTHALIGLWTAIEVAVEDTICLILTNSPESIDLAAAHGVRVPPASSDVTAEEWARRVYSRLERRFRDSGSVSVAECYSSMLHIFGISFNLSPHTSAIVNEANYVRNCLLHRGGVIDARAQTEAPRLADKIGQTIKISSTIYLGYYDGIACFAKELLNAVVASRYIKSTTQ